MVLIENVLSQEGREGSLAFPPLATHKVDIRFWHAWQPDLRITKVQPRVWIYPYPDYVNPEARVKDIFPYDGLISLSLQAGTYRFSGGATWMKSTNLYDEVIDRDRTIDIYLKPYKTVNVRAIDVSVSPSVSLTDVKIECNNFVPGVAYTKLLPGRTLPIAIFDYGYDAYRKRVTVTASKPGYESRTKTVNTDADNWDETILFGLRPTGWVPPPPKFEHTYVEKYKDYEIHDFHTIPTYGVYLLPGESPPTSPVSLEKWRTNTTIIGARGIIENLVGKPVFKQNYPPSKSHMDPGWKIYQEPGGSKRIWAVDAGTNQPISAYWSKDDLNGLLAWIDNNFVTTGHIWTHQGIPIDFQLNGHRYYAKVGIHGKNFYNWAFQDTLDWIDKELEEPEPEPAKGSITSYNAPASATPGDTITASATTKNVGAASGSFRLRLRDRDTNVEVDSTSLFTLAAGSSTTKTLTGTMPNKDWNLKLTLERTLPTGAVTVDAQKTFTAINIVNWWAAIRARWNSLTRWQKTLIVAGTVGGIVKGGTTLYTRG